MSEIMDLVWKARNRRAFRTPRPTNPTNPIGAYQPPRRRADLSERAETPRNLSPSEAKLREIYNSPTTADGNEAPYFETFPEPKTPVRSAGDKPAERELADRYSAPAYVPKTITGSEEELARRYTSTAPTTEQSAPVNQPARTLSPTEQKLRDYYAQKYDALTAREEAVNARREALKDKNFEDDDSKLHNFGKGAAYAMRNVQRTGNSQADLGATLGSALGGGLRNLFNKKEDDIRENEAESQQIKKDREELNKENEQFIINNLRIGQAANLKHDNDRQDRQDKYKAELDERNGLLRQLQLTKRYKRGENAAFDSQLEQAGIQQPDFEPGKKINPRYWNRDTGIQMTFDENGRSVPVLDKDGNPVVSDAEKNVSSNGYSVRPGQALNYEGQVEASRVSANNQTAGNEREYKVGLAKIDSKIQSSNTAIANANKRLAEIEELTGIEKIKAVDEKKELLKQIREEQAEIAGYETEKKLLPAPVQVQGRTGGTVFTEFQARDYYTKQGIPAAEIERRIQNGKTQGIIK